MNHFIKGLSLSVIIVFMLLVSTACTQREIVEGEPSMSASISSIDSSSSSPALSSEEATTSSNSVSESMLETTEVEVTTVTPTPVPTATPTPVPTATPTPAPTPIPTLVTPIVSPDGRSGTQLNTPYLKNGVILVNKQHWVNREYAPLPAADNKWSLQPEAWSAWKRMEADAKMAGQNLRFVSGYRTFDYQYELFNNYASRDPQGANRYSARAGQSEHQTGLALDIDNGQVGLVANFAETAEGQWLWSNAWNYGWILRYPQGKEEITGYIFEPWHYRYVGINVAAEFGPQNVLTLEEYLDERPAKYR